jgi:hypothetical protein
MERGLKKSAEFDLLLREVTGQKPTLVKGVPAPPKTIVQNPDLAVYIDGFGTHSGDEGSDQAVSSPSLST